jgi:hypothetical protein
LSNPVFTEADIDYGSVNFEVTDLTLSRLAPDAVMDRLKINAAAKLGIEMLNSGIFELKELAYERDPEQGYMTRHYQLGGYFLKPGTSVNKLKAALKNDRVRGMLDALDNVRRVMAGDTNITGADHYRLRTNLDDIEKKQLTAIEKEFK